MRDNNSQPFIAMAWGTAALDAFLISPEGEVLGHVNKVVDLKSLDRTGIETQFLAVTDAWPEAEKEVWLAGMIGSAMGWQNVPHRQCPADAAMIAGASASSEIAGRPVRISPGLSTVALSGAPDLLRGEEMAALGLLESPAKAGAYGLLASVPGAHGKWINLKHGMIYGFHTAMTVELGKTLAAHALIGQSMSGQPQAGAPFDAAACLAAGSSGLARLLFEVRTRASVNEFSAEGATSHFWGLLFGADAADAAQLYDLKPQTAEVAVVGASPFDALLARALAVQGYPSKVLNYQELTALGFARVRAQLARNP